MRSNTLNPLHFILPASVKIILAFSVFVYGVFNFSAHHWVLLGLLIVAVLAIAERISRLTATAQTTSLHHRVVDTDGGTFSQQEKRQQSINSHPVVQDGGLYKRKD